MPNFLPSGFLEESDDVDLAELLADFEASLKKLDAHPGDVDLELEKHVCLASRSAFVEFAAIREIDLYVNSDDSALLEKLLDSAIQLVSEAKYRDSISGRLKQLRRFDKERGLETADSEHSAA